MHSNRRPRSIDTALAAFNPRAPRRGRLMTQARRGLVAHDGVATTAQLLAWCYPRERCYWHLDEIRRALRQLGVKEIGRARGQGRPIYLVDPIKIIGNRQQIIESYQTDNKRIRGNC